MTIINQITSFKISGFSFNGTDTQLNYTAGVTGGIAQPSKSLVLNASSNITTGINSLTATSLVSTNLTVNGVSFTSSVINNILSLDGVTEGIATGEKVLIVDASRNIININNLTASTLTGTLQTANQNVITQVGTLISLTSNGNVNIAQHNGTDTGLHLNGTLVTATASDINKLKNMITTTNELNILSGLTSSTSELNRLTGLTSSTVELNRLTGVTATNNQLNFLSGATAGTVVANKAIVVDSSRNIVNIGNITSTGSITLSTGRLFLSNSINGLSHSYTTGGSAEIITSTNGLDTNYIGTNTDNDFSLAVNAIRHLTIKKTTGYIGVGTNLPNRELEVSEQSGNCLRLSNSGSNSYLDMIINNQGILTLTLNGTSPSFNFSHSLSTISTTASTNTTSGALVVAGGVGIAGNTNIGGNLNLGGNITNVGTLALNGANDVITLTNTNPANRTSLKFVNDTRSWELGSRGSGLSVANSFYLFDNTLSAYRMVINSSGDIGIGTTTPTVKLDVTGAIRLTNNILYAQSASSWTGTSFNGLTAASGAVTFTNTSVTNGGVITSINGHHINQITLAAQNTNVTTTNASSVYIANAPAAGANMTITNNYALWINAGRTLLNDNTSSSNSTSGALIVMGGVGIGGTVNIGGGLSVSGSISGQLSAGAQTGISQVGTLTSLTSSGIVSITNATASSTTGNGALVVTGGVGIGGNTNIGGNGIITGNLTIGNTTNTIILNSINSYTSTYGTASVTLNSGNIYLKTNTSLSATANFDMGLFIQSSHVTPIGFGIQLNNGINTTSTNAALIGTISSNDFGFTTNNSRRMTITSSGNVGIGLSNPLYRLDVSGNINLTGALSFNGNSLTSSVTELNYVDTSAGTAEASKALVLDASRNITNINSLTCTNTLQAPTIQTATSGANILLTGSIMLLNETNAKGRIIANNGDSTLYIQAGNTGDANSSADIFFGNFSVSSINSTRKVIIKADGKVGLGMTAPAYPLDVIGDINCSKLIRTTDGLNHTNGSITLRTLIDSTVAYIGTTSNHSISIQTNNADRIRITHSGFVGIGGVTSPSLPLEVGTTTVTYNAPYGYLSGAGTGVVSSGSTGNQQFSAKFNGRIYVTDEVDVFSDRRIKENIREITEDESERFINAIKPVHFKYKNNDKKAYGYIAQDIMKAGFADIVQIHNQNGLEEEIEDDGFVNPKDYGFTLAYDEIPAILHKYILKQNDKIKNLEQVMKEMKETIDFLLKK
jgi:hypothetical protein